MRERPRELMPTTRPSPERGQPTGRGSRSPQFTPRGAPGRRPEGSPARRQQAEARPATWQRGLRPLLPSWEQRAPSPPRRLEAGKRFRRAPREAAGEGRPAAPGSLFSVGRRPPSHPPTPTGRQSPGADPRLHSPPTDKGDTLVFFSLRAQEGPPGPPRPPTPTKDPPALRAGLGDSHTSPPGGRSAGLLRLGWSRANG